MEDISNKTLALLLVIAIVVSLVGIFTAENGGVITISGRATDYGTAQFEQLSIASINVTRTINFGIGSPDRLETYADLYSDNGTTKNGNWSFSDQALLVINDGTVNITVEIQSNETADQFIGGGATTPLLEYYVQQEETDSCPTGILNGSSYNSFGANQDDTANEYALICNELDTDPAKNALNVSVHVRIPKDAPTGNRQVQLTFRGQSVN